MSYMRLTILWVALLLVSCGSGDTLIPADVDLDRESDPEISDGDDDPQTVEHQCFESKVQGPSCSSEIDCMLPSRCGLPPEGYDYECRAGICYGLPIDPTDGDDEREIEDSDIDPEPDNEEVDGDGPDLDEDQELDAERPEADELDCVFCPKDTGLTCGDLPEEGEIATILEETDAVTGWNRAFWTGEWVIFPFHLAASQRDVWVGGCNLSDHSLYLLGDPYFEQLYMEGNEDYIIYEEADGTQGSYRYRLVLGDLRTWKTKILQDWGVPWTDFTVSNHYASYSYSGQPVFLYNTETEQTSATSDFRVDGHHHDGKTLVLRGKPELAEDAYRNYDANTDVWQTDIQSLEPTPVAVSYGFNSSGQVEGEYIAFTTSREAVPYESWWRDSYEIYLFDRKYKREIPISSTPHTNEAKPFIEYPYVGWWYGPELKYGGGPQRVANLETGEMYEFSGWTDQRSHIRDRYVTWANDSVYMYKLPEAGRIPADYDCEDDNPCTDDHWRVSIAGCHHAPNHDRCDDGNPETPFDICIGGSCTGLQLGSDESIMADVPAGIFVWGADVAPDNEESQRGQAWEGPQREEYLPTFSIDILEVTNRKYKTCVFAGACASPKRNRSGRIMDYWTNPAYEDYPVLFVDWYEARNYCEWVDKRLPTEAEWVKAARGMDDVRIYPWGDSKPGIEDRKCNLAYNQEEPFDVAAGGSFTEDVSPYGVYDMAGNLSEWTSSPWTPDGLDGTAIYGNDLMVLKGGHWRDTAYYTGWIDDRSPATPWSPGFAVGFRCVKPEE